MANTDYYDSIQAVMAYLGGWKSWDVRMMHWWCQMAARCSSFGLLDEWRVIFPFLAKKKPLEPLRAAHEPLWVIFISSAFQEQAINMTQDAESSWSRAERSRGNTTKDDLAKLQSLKMLFKTLQKTSTLRSSTTSSCHLCIQRLKVDVQGLTINGTTSLNASLHYQLFVKTETFSQQTKSHRCLQRWNTSFGALYCMKACNTMKIHAISKLGIFYLFKVLLLFIFC